jgi:hypothetical protein
LALHLLLAARLHPAPVELGTVPTQPDDRVLESPFPAPRAAPVGAPPAVLPLPAPLAMLETARYRIGYGLLGQVGEIRTAIQGDHFEGAARLVAVGGSGEGSIFGLGRLRTRVDSHFDPSGLGSRRWTAAQWKDDQATVDIVEQARPGNFTFERRRSGRPPVRQSASLPAATFDPLGFILRLRIAPPAPQRTQVLQVLEGNALWRVTLTTAGTQPLPDSAAPIRALRIDGHLDPIRYDGAPDGANRPHRTFTLWLSDDAARVPLRLSVPVGIGDVVVQLVEVQRRARPGESPAAASP